VGPQDHVTGMVSNDGIGMHCAIIEEVCESLEGGLVLLACWEARVPRATNMVGSTVLA